MRIIVLIAVCVVAAVASLDSARGEIAERPAPSEPAPVSRGLPWEQPKTQEAPTSVPRPSTASLPKPADATLSPEIAPGAAPSHSTGDTPNALIAGEPHRIVAIIRETLLDPEVTKGAEAGDVAALKAFYATWNGAPLWMTDMGLTARGQAVVSEIEKADDQGLDADAFALPQADALPKDEAAQALSEIALDLALLKYARFARGGRHVPSDIDDLFDQTPPLKDPAAVIAGVAEAEAPEAFLRTLHPRHEQFARLQSALVAARAAEKPDEAEIRRLIMNMERWRWMPEDLGRIHVLLNTPDFMLHYVKDGETVFSDKTLVGATKYPTPVFSADMEAIVFNPDWIAPPSVLRDKLWPALKRKQFEVLKSNQLKVRYKGKPIDPRKIDWKRTNIYKFTFSQRAGPKNVLGKAKFLYPNKHIVYMHDTLPYRRKNFEDEIRAVGFGCVRMERPQRFAALLLAEDQDLPASEVADLWKNKVNSRVEIEKDFPVHTTYFTAVVDENGKLSSFPDLYGLDRKHAKVLFDKSKAQGGAIASSASAAGGR